MKISRARSCGCFFALIAAGLSLQTMVCLAQMTFGFEEGMPAWNPSQADIAAGLSTVVAEAAHSGQMGLRVKQDDTGPGSWIQSPQLPFEVGKALKLTFWARCLQPSNVCVFVTFYDADRHSITADGTNGNLLAIPPTATNWTEFHLDLKVPTGAEAVSFTVHAGAKHACLADFDDFSITTSDAPAAK